MPGRCRRDAGAATQARDVFPHPRGGWRTTVDRRGAGRRAGTAGGRARQPARGAALGAGRGGGRARITPGRGTLAVLVGPWTPGRGTSLAGGAAGTRRTWRGHSARGPIRPCAWAQLGRSPGRLTGRLSTRGGAVRRGPGAVPGDRRQVG